MIRRFATTLVLVSTATIFRATAQKIGADSQGRSVFTYYTTSPRVELGNDDELAASLSLFRWPIPFVYADTTKRNSDGSRRRTVDKALSLTTRLAVLNAGDDILLSKLLSTRLGMEGRVGVQTTLDTVYSLEGIAGYQNFGIQGIYGFDNFMYYNKETNVVSHEKPITRGLELNYGYFSSNRSIKLLGKSRLFRWAFATSATAKQTWNDDNLINYQDVDKATITPTAVAVDDFRGRFGTLRENIWDFRLSGSLPLYFWRLNPIPYVVLSTTFKDEPRIYPGILLNILSSKIKATEYVFPSAIGIGIDWANVQFRKPNVFLRGSITLGE